MYVYTPCCFKSSGNISPFRLGLISLTYALVAYLGKYAIVLDAGSSVSYAAFTTNHSTSTSAEQHS